VPVYYFFPDNTVLINFAMLARHNIVEWFVRGRGNWALSVARECGKSSQWAGLDMAAWSAVFGKPLAPTQSELVDARTIAERLRKPGDSSPAQHMGEAESIAIIKKRNIEAVFLTDDHDAARTAIAENIEVASTTRILAIADAFGRVSHLEARRCVEDLLKQNRVLGNRLAVSEFESYVEMLRTRP